MITRKGWGVMSRRPTRGALAIVVHVGRRASSSCPFGGVDVDARASTTHARRPSFAVGVVPADNMGLIGSSLGSVARCACRRPANRHHRRRIASPWHLLACGCDAALRLCVFFFFSSFFYIAPLRFLLLFFWFFFWFFFWVFFWVFWSLLLLASSPLFPRR